MSNLQWCKQAFYRDYAGQPTLKTENAQAACLVGHARLLPGWTEDKMVTLATAMGFDVKDYAQAITTLMMYNDKTDLQVVRECFEKVKNTI